METNIVNDSIIPFSVTTVFSISAKKNKNKENITSLWNTF